MKKLIVLFVVGQLLATLALGQDAGSQGSQKIIVQTPFGPKEIEAPIQTNTPPAQAPAVASPPQTVVPTTPPANPPATPADAQPAPTPPQAVPAQQQDQDAGISLIFDNQDIYQIIRIIGDELNLNYIIDPAVRGTVNISTLGNLRRSDLLPILETILKINGATMVRMGNFYQILPSAAVARQPIPIQERTNALNPDDQMVTQIIRMKFVAAAEMSRLLTTFVGEGGNIVVHDAGNILLITDRRSNLRKLLEIVDLFDSNAFEGERVRLYPVKNNFAKDLITDLKTIFSGYALSENATAIRFVLMDRMNSILVVTPNVTVFPEVEKWIERLDQPIATAGLRNFVYKMKNSKASDVQRVISQLYGTRMPANTFQPPPAPPGAGTPSSVPSSSGTGATTSQGASPSSPFGAPGGNQGIPIIQNGTVNIIADEINNALVIQTTPQLYADLERTIQELDVLPRQVLIDAQIYEVTLDDSLSLGLSAILQNRGSLSTPQTTASFATPASGPAALNAQNVLLLGRARELLSFLNASENRSRVRTLSAPSVLVSDNMVADFQVGAEVPIPTSSSVTPVQSGGTNLFAQTIQFRPTGVILRVKPQANESGNVTLEISQEVSQAGANTTSGVVAPVIGKSAVSSTVVVQDGQTIALGGFIRESNEYGRARIPLLGRVPGLGILFGNTRKSSNRTELIVLITPHVLRTHQDADLATEELKARLREVQKLLN